MRIIASRSSSLFELYLGFFSCNWSLSLRSATCLFPARDKVCVSSSFLFNEITQKIFLRMEGVAKGSKVSLIYLGRVLLLSRRVIIDSGSTRYLASANDGLLQVRNESFGSRHHRTSPRHARLPIPIARVSLLSFQRAARIAPPVLSPRRIRAQMAKRYFLLAYNSHFGGARSSGGGMLAARIVDK